MTFWQSEDTEQDLRILAKHFGDGTLDMEPKTAFLWSTVGTSESIPADKLAHLDLPI
jgi:hypothetical protein